MSNTKIKAGQFSGIVGNGTDGYFLMTNGDGTMAWEAAATPSPTVTSVTYPGDDTAADPAGGQSVTLTGTNFATGATVTIGGTTAPTVSFVSATELTITTPAKAAGDYDIVVTNTDGGTATFVDGISYNGIPSWTTASGSLGTFASDTTISTITLQASEPDAGTITFNITSGALPTGLSLTGADIDGTTSKETADTLYNFTVTAIDDENQSTPRAFSITVEKYIVPAPENFEIVTYTGNGGTQAITSKIGKAASFNGSSSVIDTALNYAALPTNTSWAVSCWINNSDNTITSAPISLMGGINGWGLFLQSGNVQLATDGSTPVATTGAFATLANNTWMNVVISYDGSGTTTLYYDGIFGATVSFTFSAITSGNLKIGKAPYWSYFKGKIDQVRIFDKAISSSEVTTLYNEDYDSSTKSTTDIFGDGSGVALYELDEDAGDSSVTQFSSIATYQLDGNANDLTGNYNGTWASPSYATGVFGQAAVFSSSNTGITNSNLKLNSAEHSVSMWINTTTLATGKWNTCFLSSFTGFPSGFFGRRPDTTDFHYRTESGNELYFTLSNTNTWYHILATRDANGVKIYVNGSFVTSNNDSLGTVPSSGYNVSVIGSNNLYPNEYFQGSIDQVRIYNKALSADNVNTLYNETVATASTNIALDLVGLYNGTPTNVNFLGMAFQPDLVWIKKRSGGTARDNMVYDSIRGAGYRIRTNQTYAESYASNELTSFDSNGLSLGDDDAVNGSTYSYVAWCWKAGGAAVSNTDGSITSTVSANPDAGFSIVKFTVPASGDFSAGHGLSSTPELVITKSTDTFNWFIYHKDLSSGANGVYMLQFNTNAENGNFKWWGSGMTSSVIGGTSGTAFDASTETIAYCFHSVDGYQKVGSYAGNSSTSGNIITTGFKPRFLLVKNISNSTSTHWGMFDSIRDATNPNTGRLLANLSNEEVTTDSNWGFNFLSNGFEPTVSSNQANASGSTYIYLAIA